MAAQDDIRSLTSARGIAAMWVVLFHLDAMWEGLIPLGPLRKLVQAGWLAVPFFFILSGYVIGLRYVRDPRLWTARSTARFLALRFGRIYPVHFVMLVATGIVVARHGFADGHSLSSLEANLFLVQAWTRTLVLSWNWPSWSISAEWFAYLLFPASAAAIALLKRRHWTVVAFLTCAAASVAVYAIPDLPYKAMVQVVPTFFGGVVLSQLLPPGQAPWAARMLAPVSVALLVWPFLSPNDATEQGGYIVLFYALLVALRADSPRSLANWAPLVFLGDVSYSLYMTHALTLTLFARFLPMVSTTGSPFARASNALAMLACVCIVATVMYRLVERPSRAASRQLVSRMLRADMPTPQPAAPAGEV